MLGALSIDGIDRDARRCGTSAVSAPVCVSPLSLSALARAGPLECRERATLAAHTLYSSAPKSSVERGTGRRTMRGCPRKGPNEGGQSARVSLLDVPARPRTAPRPTRPHLSVALPTTRHGTMTPRQPSTGHQARDCANGLT